MRTKELNTRRQEEAEKIFVDKERQTTQSERYDRIQKTVQEYTKNYDGVDYMDDRLCTCVYEITLLQKQLCMKLIQILNKQCEEEFSKLIRETMARENMTLLQQQTILQDMRDIQISYGGFHNQFVKLSGELMTLSEINKLISYIQNGHIDGIGSILDTEIYHIKRILKQDIKEEKDIEESKQQKSIWKYPSDMSTVCNENILVTQNIIDNINIINDDSIESDYIYLKHRIINSSLSFLVTSNIDCTDLEIKFSISMDNIKYCLLDSNFITSYYSEDSIQIIIKEFIPIYMKLIIINSSLLISNTTVYLTY
jgi:hypothetical protein